MHEESSIQKYTQTLRIISELKCVLKDFLETCTKSQSMEAEDLVSVIGIQNILKYLLSSYGSLEKSINGLGGNINFSLGNLYYLAQDPSPEKANLYVSALKAYRWSSMLTENANTASTLIAQNSLKRTTNNSLINKKSRQLSLHNVSSQMIDLIVNGMNRLFSDMTVVVVSTNSADTNTTTGPHQATSNSLPEEDGKMFMTPAGIRRSTPFLTSLQHQSNTVLLDITVGTTLRAKVCLRSLIIEAVAVRGFDEVHLIPRAQSSAPGNDIVNAAALLFNESAAFNLAPNAWYWSNVPYRYIPSGAKDQGNSNNMHEMWVESRYYVFRKITEYAQAAMLHFYSPLIPELAIKSFMTWLHSYSTLFSATCHRCQKQLKDFMPPTWRDFRTLEPYHEFCRF